MWWKILLGIFAVIFLILWQNIHVMVAYDGEFKLIAGLGIIRLDILKLLKKPKEPKEEKPEKEEKKKDKGEKKEEKEKKEKPPNVFKEVWILRGVDGVIDLLGEFSSMLYEFDDRFIKHFVIRKIYIRYSVSGEDSAQTAKKFGLINALVYTNLGLIGSRAKLKKHDTIITPDYLGNQDYQEIEIHISYKILSILALLLFSGKDLIKIITHEKKVNQRIKTKSNNKKSKQAV